MVMRNIPSLYPSKSKCNGCPFSIKMTFGTAKELLLIFVYIDYVFGFPKINNLEQYDHPRVRRNAVQAAKLENDNDNILSYVSMVVFTILLLR